MVEEEDKADLAGVVGLKHLLDCDEVLERLRHFATGDVQVARVPEVVHPCVASVVCLALSNLVVMVRELEVDATGMDVDGRIG